MKKNSSTTNNININFNISNINNDNNNNNHIKNLKKQSIETTYKKNAKMPSNVYDLTQDCHKNLFSPDERANKNYKTNRSENYYSQNNICNTNSNQILPTEGNVLLSDDSNWTSSLYNKNEIKNNATKNNEKQLNSFVRKSGGSEKFMSNLIKEPTNASITKTKIKERNEILKMDLIKSMKGILDLKESINLKKKKPNKYGDGYIRHLYSFTNINSPIKKIKHSYPEAEEAECPEDMHFFYVSMLQKGKKFERIKGY